jgi:ATP-dependent RNA helicase RhlE
VQKGKAISFCSPEEKPMLDIIEDFLGKPITELEISKSEYAETLDLTNDAAPSWNQILQEIDKNEAQLEEWKKKKKKKKR